MMKNNQQAMIPILFEGAGACLTNENWQAAGVNSVSCFLDTLLHKPGIALLSQVCNINQYLGFSGPVIIIALKLPIDSDVPFSLRSPFDGSLLTLKVDEIWMLIKHLKPAYIALSTETLTWVNNNPEVLDKTTHAFAVEDLKAHGITNQPAEDAYHGLLYTHAGTIDINTPLMATNFELIEKSCTCETCEQKLTRAYLHHLLANTPLLAHRFLIMHNVHFCLHADEKK